MRDFDELRHSILAETDEEFEAKNRQLSVERMKAKINGNASRYYAIGGELETRHALRSGDYSGITGKGANRNNLI